MFKECLKNNIFPFIIEDEYKRTYYECLQKAQIDGDYKPLKDFFIKEQKKYYDYVMDLIKDYSLNEDNDNSDK